MAASSIEFEIEVTPDGEFGIWKRPGVEEHLEALECKRDTDPWLFPVDDWIKDNGLCG